ncbi:hypothetical protein SCP_0104910 [Sparassis crispa]|uniref:Zn(2)-C6 fungal-type domain-containing protein n=1 Tax=Sparassis crispa TaxID=139825 RepID=A0A401G620_9APHY|nr:hypothetical protein SCP_0104910 [Sparassis crispa]GBE77611.1 hypothetical protein SCP_0104910 [Sparassis crispa]
MPPVTEKEHVNGTTNGELKQRRRPGRVPVSCAECRRLKLRCDRKVPCETCVKRGCAAICPEGSLTTGRANRGAIAGVEELHRDIERLRTRCATLEDALRTLQAKITDEPHPLLSDSPNSSGTPEWSGGPTPDGPLLSRADEEVLDSFGTLTLGLRGEARFFGQTSRSEYLIHAPCCGYMSYTSFPHLSKELIDEAIMELDVPCENPTIHEEIRRALPSLSQAYRLCEIFLEYGQYVWYPIPREQVFDEIMGEIYRATPPSDTCFSCSHATSLLFAIFALATLFDLDAPPYAIEAHEYYLLARLCLRFAPPIRDTTLTAVQSLVYMAQYLELSDCEPAHTGSQKAWLLVGLAVKLGYSVGLHVNSSRWKLDDDASQRRSRVFWELFMQDTWISFGFGRPPSMSMSFIDCEFPKDTQAFISESGARECSYHNWTWQFSKLLHTIVSTAFGAKSPSYATVLDFDRKVRDFPVPPHLRPDCTLPEFERMLPSFFMRGFFVVSSKESTLLSLHRPFFVQALNEQPADLLRHRYGPSVMAIYRSAWRSINGAKEVFKRMPAVISRFGLTWSQCIAGGIVMCLLVTRAPSSPLASSALQELVNLCELFERAAETCQIASNNLDVVRKLYRQGHETMSKSQSQKAPGMTANELDRLGGKTHLISSNSDIAQQCPYAQPRRMDPFIVPVPAPVPAEFIHPTIMQDLRSFDGLNPSGYVGMEPSPFYFDLLPGPSGAGAGAGVGAGGFASSSVEITPEVFDQFFAQNGFAAPVVEPEQFAGPPVLDSTWQSFVEQLGF